MIMFWLVIIEMDVMNVYVLGICEDQYMVMVMCGLMNWFDWDEFEVVLVYEFSYICYVDVCMMVIVIIFVGIIFFVAEIIFCGLL